MAFHRDFEIKPSILHHPGWLKVPGSWNDSWQPWSNPEKQLGSFFHPQRGGFRKWWVLPPNHPFVQGRFSIIFTIHFGGPPLFLETPTYTLNNQIYTLNGFSLYSLFSFYTQLYINIIPL